MSAGDPFSHSPLFAETQEHLFEPFYTTKPAGVGTGLGLSTVYRIVRLSGGWISVYSEKGVGTSVEIYLPCAEGEKAEAVVAPRVPTEGGDETILVVEDSAEVRHFIRAVLRNLGYTVIATGGGAEAVAAFEGPAAPIDLLIIDVVLPDSSGHDVARQLRESKAGLTVLYISGHQLDNTVMKEMLRPGVGFLQKPFTGEALALRVRESLQSGNRPPRPLRG
ncbi:MAG: response regulator [Bryobacteraceae bacterium]